MPELPHICVLSCSLSQNSRSRILCRHAYAFLKKANIPVAWVDLAEERVLPYGMGGSEGLENIRVRLETSRGIILGFPVYNFTMNSSLKAVIERFGRTFEDKVVGLMMAAGGRSSYMSGMDVASSLMLDFRTWIVPRFVYATKDAFDEERTRIESPEIESRVEQLAHAVATVAWQKEHSPPFS